MLHRSELWIPLASFSGAALPLDRVENVLMRLMTVKTNPQRGPEYNINANLINHSLWFVDEFSRGSG